jgi:hypothetical protein
LKEHNETDAKAIRRSGSDLELFIVHPTMDPVEISTAPGLDAEFAHRVGDQRRPQKGRRCQARIKTRDGDIAAATKLPTNGLPARFRS